jgi:hypothetical protein
LILPRLRAESLSLASETLDFKSLFPLYEQMLTVKNNGFNYDIFHVYIYNVILIPGKTNYDATEVQFIGFLSRVS